MTTLRTLLVAALFAAGISSASAALYSLSGTIDGAQANAGAGTGSPGTGSIIGTFDDVSLLLSWNIAWAGLQGSVTAAHFHGPALPNQNAGVQVSIGTSNPAISSATISAAQGNDLVNGLWYVNIHSTVFPGGEIRGQVNAIPEPSGAILAAFVGFLALGRRRR